MAQRGPKGSREDIGGKVRELAPNLLCDLEQVTSLGLSLHGIGPRSPSQLECSLQLDSFQEWGPDVEPQFLHLQSGLSNSSSLHLQGLLDRARGHEQCGWESQGQALLCLLGKG